MENRVTVAKALHLGSEGIESHADLTYSTFEILNKIPKISSFAVKWDSNIEPLSNPLLSDMC